MNYNKLFKTDLEMKLITYKGINPILFKKLEELKKYEVNTKEEFEYYKKIVGNIINQLSLASQTERLEKKWKK